MADPDNADKPRAGHVRHDAGGRAVWEWARESGRHAIDSTSHLLKKLELTGLTLMGEDKPWENDAAKREGAPPMPVQPQRAPTDQDPPAIDPAVPRSERGFNPYDTRPLVRRPPTAAKPPVTPVKKRGWLARLFGRR